MKTKGSKTTIVGERKLNSALFLFQTVCDTLHAEGQSGHLDELEVGKKRERERKQ